jgi:DNA-binding NarL/FixJ family response regulator
VNILLVDDHTILREGVASFIESDEICDVLFSAPDIGAARTIIEEEKVDLVITDLNFPEESGLMLLDYLKSKRPEVPAIVLSMQDDHETIQDTLTRGARGYITKSSGFTSLSRAIKEVSAGGYHFDQRILSKLVACMISSSPSDISSSSDKLLELLSNREKEVFLLLAKNIKLEKISEQLFISTKTVENHRSQIYKSWE